MTSAAAGEQEPIVVGAIWSSRIRPTARALATIGGDQAALCHFCGNPRKNAAAALKNEVVRTARSGKGDHCSERGREG